jgi:polysaccharide pyruvyl transferase WcaK-like protein
MMVEIHGAWVHNKGAHLMLQTAAEKLRQGSVPVNCCMEPYPDPYEDRAACRMFQIFPATLPPWAGFKDRIRYGVKLSLGKMLGPHQRHMFGLTLRRDIDALVDISGYRLGDAWGKENLEWMAFLTGECHKAGKPVVLLPQMFGPFQKPGSAEWFRRILENADLVFARERISLEHAKSVGGRHDHIHLAPDITIFADPRGLSDTPLCERRYACVIPNMRIMDKSGDEWGKVYIDRLESACRTLLATDLTVYILLHDQWGDDAKLASELLKRLRDDRVQLYSEEDPLRAKAFIAGARLLVGSRFHALVGALATGVPVVALGWAHKYDMLLEEFGVSDYMHKASSGTEHLTGLIERLLDDREWQASHEVIQAAKGSMAAANSEMWARVFSVLGLRPNAACVSTSCSVA